MRGLLLLAAAIIAGLCTSAALSRAQQAWRWDLPEGMAPPPVPADNPMSAAKVALGRRLFHDGDLSINGTLSCATCHEQKRGFTASARAHPGAHGEPGLRNPPSLVNVGWYAPLTWADPASRTLEAQALTPIVGDDPVEMGMTGHEAELARRLGANACYRKLFARAFPETRGRIDLPAVAKALAAFQRTIVGFGSDWDKGPLSPAAQRGEALFRGTAGCAACHQGVHFSDLRFHPFATHAADSGMARATGRATDAGLFRTPSLRNAALTAPYLHDGSADTLPEAIARHGIALSPDQAADVVQFLESLTDRDVTTNPALSRPPRDCD